MNRFILFLLAAAACVISLQGCVSYTTLQTAKTIDAGNVLIGGGVALAVGDNASRAVPEFDVRVGITKNLDIGGKFILPSLYFLDAKVQFLEEPIAVAADLGWSYFSYDDQGWGSRGKSTGWYPMIIAGQDSWYVAVKRVYFSTSGQFEFFGLHNYQGSGWISTNVVLGGVLGKSIRFLPELNIIIPEHGGKALLVPAVGLQFVL